jgi:hypothetical protein
MAFETELSNIAIPTDVVSDGLGMALTSAVVVVPLIYKENLPVGTNVKKVRKDGKLEAVALSESSNYTYDANSELTQTSITATATKQVAVYKNTVESEQFASVNQGVMGVHLGRALARLLDDNVITLFSSFTTNTIVAEPAGLTGVGLLRAKMRVDASLAGSNRNLVAVVNHRQAFDIRSEIFQSAAANFAQPSQISLLQGYQAPNGFAGTLPGLDIYVTDGLPTGGGDATALVFNPERAFFGMYSAAPIVRVNWIGSQGFFTEVTAHMFSTVVEWYDEAGCRVTSDQA